MLLAKRMQGIAALSRIGNGVMTLNVNAYSHKHTYTYTHTQASTQTRLNMYLTIQGKAKKNVAETKHLLQSQPSNASHCFIHLFLPLSVTPLQSESSWT